MFKVHLHVQDFLVKQHGMEEGAETNVQQQVILCTCVCKCARAHAQTHTHHACIYADFLLRVKCHIAKGEPDPYGSHK